MIKTIFLLILMLILRNGEAGEPDSAIDIVGKWQARDLEYPVTIVFQSDGKLDLEGPGLALRSDCQYTFDASGTPAELAVDCDNGEVSTTRGLWVTVLSGSSVHLRRQHATEANSDIEFLVNMTLHKVER